MINYLAGQANKFTYFCLPKESEFGRSSERLGDFGKRPLPPDADTTSRSTKRVKFVKIAEAQSDLI